MPSYVIPPAGTSAASLFTPGTFVDPAKPPAVLALPIDPATGDWSSILTGIHPVDDQVIEAFRVAEDSGPAVIGVGNKLGDIKKVDDTTKSKIEFEVRRCLGRIEKTGNLRIESIDATAEPDNDFAEVSVEYTNLLSMRTTTITLRVA